MAKILHLIPDEKVTDNVIENFEKIFNDNIFFILGDINNKKYCQATGHNIQFGSETLFVKENVDPDVVAIIVHGLNHIFAKMILSVNQNIKVAWFAWGFDIYFLPKLSNSLYAPETYSFLTKRSKTFTIIQRIKKNSFLRGLYYNLVVREEDYYTNYEKAHQRINFFCSYIEEDYERFTSKYQTSAVFLDIGYFSIGQYLAGQEGLSVKPEAKNILVGNSNSAECNHLDVFSILRNTKDSIDAKLIVPLNYGKDNQYRNSVLDQGGLDFGSDFEPLLDFMDRGKYFELLSSCSTAVFYHYRQQAMGNIIAFLYMGGRVYLSSRNPVFHYFNRIGVRVFDLDAEFKVHKNEVLEESVAKKNRTILQQYFSAAVISEQSKNLVEQLVDVNR